jgi:hypothetical protein
MKSAIVLAALVSVLARAELAHACSCGSPQPYVQPTGDDAPINPVVIVWVPSSVGKLDNLTLSLQKTKSGDQVAVDYRRSGSGAYGVVELLPRSKLAVDTEYKVMMVEGGGAPEAIGTFTTGKRTLSAAPEFTGFSKTGYFKDTVRCCMCRTGEPYIQLTLKDPPDDAKSSQLRFAIWAAGADGKLDYSKPPLTYQAAWNFVTLGHPSICGSANFSIPKQKSLRLGIKLVDLAGNASKPTEVTVDLTKPIDPEAKKPSP